MRVERLPYTVTGVSTGAGGILMGAGGCSGAQPVGVTSRPVPVSYGFRIDEGDGGVLALLPFGDLEQAVGGQVQTCLYSAFPTMLEATFTNSIRNLVAANIEAVVEQALTASMMAQLCLRPSDAGLCQYGTPVNGLCLAGSNCFSARHFRNLVPTIPACVR
jgi:hypothetical protein